MHVPVLLEEVLTLLNPQPGQLFIDGTINGGGHAYVLLERVQPGGRVLGIEWDGELFYEALARRESSLLKKSLTLVNDNYAQMDEIAVVQGFTGVDGVLLDLGMSSWHVDVAAKGFTFHPPADGDEPLDMRYQRVDVAGDSLTAARIVNRWPETEIARVIYEYGEERYSRSIAAAIMRQRKVNPINTTRQLVDIIAGSVPAGYRHGRIHFATRTFQALRIAVNRELDNLTRGITAALKVLRPGGVVAIISFHSLEDRIVKNAFRAAIKEGATILTPKPLIAAETEMRSNPRSRSAKLRALRR